MSLVNSLMNLIKMVGYRSSDDSGDYPIMEIEFNDNIKNAVRLSQYGFYSVAPPDSLSIVFNVDGDEEKMFGFADDYGNRFRDLKSGEVKTGNTVKGTFTYYKDDGSIQQVGEKVYLGSATVSLLEKISEVIQETIDAFNHTATTAIFPTAVGPTGTMTNPAPIVTAVSNLTSLKADIDSITGSAP